MPIPPSTFYFIGATKINPPEVSTCASLFTNSDGTFTYKGSVYKFDFDWWYFLKGAIFGLYLSISVPVFIHITL